MCDNFPVRVPNELCFGPEIPTGSVDGCQYNIGFICPEHMRVVTNSDLGNTMCLYMPH